jgi:hypothetical protein
MCWHFLSNVAFRQVGCWLLAPFLQCDDPLQMLVPLHSPDLRRQRLPLDGLQARIAQPGSLSLEGTSSRSRNEASRQLGQSGQIASLFFDDSLLEPVPDLLIRLGFCCSISLRHWLSNLLWSLSGARYPSSPVGLSRHAG